MTAPWYTALSPEAPHVRDAVDLGWVARTQLLALAPCVAVGLYNAGYQARVEPSSILDCAAHGASRFLPLFAAALVAGAFWERAFAAARRRRRAPGLSVVAVLFTAALPPELPLWQAVVGMSFGLVVGRELFGGQGRNVVHPAVVGLVFLDLAYPGALRTGGAAVSLAAAGGVEALAADGVTWSAAFLGRVPGPLATTSAAACLVGALLLVHQRVASWRTLAGFGLGVTGASLALGGPPPHWHVALGGLAFGAAFLATDPVTSAATDAGRWVHGALVGALVVLIRVANPLQEDGVLLAVLFGSVAAPSIDQVVARVHARRRRRRLAAP